MEDNRQVLKRTRKKLINFSSQHPHHTAKPLKTGIDCIHLNNCSLYAHCVYSGHWAGENTAPNKYIFKAESSALHLLNTELTSKAFEDEYLINIQINLNC